VRLERFAYGGGMRGVPWWGVVSSAAAPVLMVGGWTAAASLQPRFDPVADTVSALAAPGAADRWVMTLTFVVVGVCYVVTALALRPAGTAGRLILITGAVAGMLVAANPERVGDPYPWGHIIWASIGLQVAVPGRLAVLRPVWILPALQGILLLALVLANPHRIDRQSRVLRTLGLTLAALISFANAWSLVSLATGLVRGTEGENAGPLLVTGAAIWLTNVIVFGLWYWEFDRGGPVARALGTRPYPDFQFVQMASPQLAPPDWEPAFADYLYLAFTNAAAFSPTDVMPLSRWAKLAMTLQSAVSIVTVALIVARAVNILK